MKKLLMFTIGVLVLGFMQSGSIFAESQEDQYLIEFKSDIDQSAITDNGGKVVNVFNEIGVVTASLTKQVAKELEKEESILYIEEDGHIQANSQTINWGYSELNMPSNIAQIPDSEGIKVGIFDSGIDLDHPDLNVMGGKSFIPGTVSYDDDYGHGTSVAGIVSAINNDIGTLGVSSHVDLYSEKVLDSYGDGRYSNIIKGLEWAIEQDLDVVNMSFGGPSESKALRKALKEAEKNGILLVASAGNEGIDESQKSTITFPAAYKSVIAVGSADQSLTRSYFSSYGKELEVMAPGEELYTTAIDGYTHVSGTSFAAPYVTGLSALLLGENESLDIKEVRKTIQSTSTHLGDEDLYGKGLINVEAALNK